MMLRRVTAGLLASALLLPIVICVLLATARLLAGMEDVSGAVVLDRLSLALGLVWVFNLIALLLGVAVVQLAASEHDEPEEP